MEAGQRLPSLLQVIGARVDVGSLGERGSNRMKRTIPRG
jgi:hypothetical protein